MARLPLPHLLRLTDQVGVIEHATGAEPAREHGYCVDDVARALIVVVREPDALGDLDPLVTTYLAFLSSAIATDGRCRNRRSTDGSWTDEPEVSDAWGRAIWALGVAATRARSAAVRERALINAIVALRRRSPYVRATAFAALGAAEILATYPSFTSVRTFLSDALELLPSRPGAAWDWPEPRLRYANGALADAVMAAGAALDRPEVVQRGFEMLAWLAEVERLDGHLSVTGTAGAGPDDHRPLFDQQPIEPAAIADAAVRAWDLTADSRWLEILELAWGWFVGENDGGVLMHDPATGAGFDGLTSDGRNENRGAESTLAFLSTYQHSRRLLRREFA